MLQILETRVPRNLDTLRAISFVYGINKSTAQKICSKLGINPKVEIGKLDQEVLESITLEIEDNYVTGSYLRREKNQAIQKFVEIRSYKGTRHKRGLPVRGQRTSTNGRTQKRLGTRRLSKKY